MASISYRFQPCPCCERMNTLLIFESKFSLTGYSETVYSRGIFC